jgi:hypothetical protein
MIDYDVLNRAEADPLVGDAELDSPVAANPAPPKKPRRRSLSIAEQLRLMAEQGDVRGLLNEAKTPLSGLIEYPAYGELLASALDVLSRKDPKAFADLLHTEMLAAVGKLMVRAHFHLNELIDRDYAQYRHRHSWQLNQELDAVAATVLALHVHAAKLQQHDANAQRLLEHARKLRLANDKVEARRNRPRRPSRRQRVSENRPHTPPASRFGEGLP